MEHGGRMSELKGVALREVAGRQQTMVGAHSTEAQANGILLTDQPCRSSNRF